MPEPQIRYARTSDGVNIAYFATGDGAPLVLMDAPMSNVQHEQRTPAMRARIEATTRIARVVRYDHRGFGMSDRTVQDFSTDAFVRDLEAVVDKLDLTRFFLVAVRGSTYPIALAYAKLHPDRLIRIAAQVGGASNEFAIGLLEARGADWRFISESFARTVLGWGDDAAAAEAAAHLRASIDATGLRRWVDWSAQSTLSADLHGVAVPTLFVLYEQGGGRGHDSVRELAAGMRDAVVRVAEGSTQEERLAYFTAQVTAFFSPGAAARPATDPQSRQPTSSGIVLFADIADSTALTERLGDARFRDASRALDERLREVIRANGGSAVEGKLLGDGVMAVFASARDAIAAALQCNESAVEGELALHIGLHAGDVIRESDNVFGGTVNIAARICDASPPGEVLVSDVVRGMARTSAGVTFEDRGEREMKGVGEPVRVYAVRPERS